MNRFQTIILIIFIAFVVIGVVLFATFRGNSQREANIETLIWGTENQVVFNNFLKGIRNKDKNSPKIRYVQKNEKDFDTEVVEAIASGRGPDVIFLSEDSVLRFEDKILLIPSESFSIRDFKDTFIEEGELYLTEGGTLALPFTIDPLVMYWNRDIFRSSGLAQVPEFWDELFALAERITERDQSLNILKSAVALGEYSNVNNAKEIISALILQAGSPILERKEGRLEVVLGDKFNFVTPPAVSSLRFYTEFSNPTKTIYSWNRSLPNSKDAFISGDLAIYLGFSSELKDIRGKNPNLNFDVARIPQVRTTNTASTFGKIKGLAILRSSSKITVAFKTISYLIGKDIVADFSASANLPPVRRDLLSRKQKDAYMSVFYDSALISKSFLDPDKNESDEIFKGMVERILSGENRISTSISRAHRELELLIK